MFVFLWQRNYGGFLFQFSRPYDQWHSEELIVVAMVQITTKPLKKPPDEISAHTLRLKIMGVSRSSTVTHNGSTSNGEFSLLLVAALVPFSQVPNMTKRVCVYLCTHAQMTNTEFCLPLFYQKVHFNLIQHTKCYFPDRFRHFYTIFRAYLANCVFETQSPFR
jgi:hypothetical protein